MSATIPFRQWFTTKTVTVIFVVVLCLFIASPAIAQLSGSGVLQVTQDQMYQTEKWFDKLWQTTFDPKNLNGDIWDYIFSTYVRMLFLLAVLFWLWRVVMPILVSNDLTSLVVGISKTMFALFLAALFLYNNGTTVRGMIYDYRIWTNNAKNGMMSIRLMQVNIKEALSDVLLSKKSNDMLTFRFQICEAMDKPSVVLPSLNRPTDPKVLAQLTSDQHKAYAYIDCMKSLERHAKLVRSAIDADCGGNSTSNCAHSKRWAKRMEAAVREASKVEYDQTVNRIVPKWDNPKNTLLTQLFGKKTADDYRAILNYVQWIFLSLMEFGFFISALAGPIFVAASIIPSRLNLIVGWVISLFTITISQFLYIAVIGAMSISLAENTTLYAGDTRFEMALGLFAPGICLAFCTGGGIAAARSFSGQSTAVVSAAASLASGVVGTLGFSLSRALDAKR
jgi:hypothetical protein